MCGNCGSKASLCHADVSSNLNAQSAYNKLPSLFNDKTHNIFLFFNIQLLKENNHKQSGVAKTHWHWS